MSVPENSFLHKIREPIITNRGLDLLAALSWLSFAWWGLASTVASLPSMAAASSDLYETVWGGSIGLLGLVASFAAVATFFRIPGFSRVTKRHVEFAALLLLTGCIAVYPLVLTTQSVGGNEDRIAAAGLAFYYLLFPIWRLIHLNCRIKALKQGADSDSDG